jgi:hypothetical protein
MHCDLICGNLSSTSQFKYYNPEDPGSMFPQIRHDITLQKAAALISIDMRTSSIKSFSISSNKPHIPTRGLSTQPNVQEFPKLGVNTYTNC